MAEFGEPERMAKMWNLLFRQLDVGQGIKLSRVYCERYEMLIENTKNLDTFRNSRCSQLSIQKLS